LQPISFRVIGVCLFPFPQPWGNANLAIVGSKKKPVAKNVFEAYCFLCKKTLKLGTLGVRALESHAKSENVVI